MTDTELALRQDANIAAGNLPSPVGKTDGSLLKTSGGAALWVAPAAIAETDFTFTDIATANVSTSKHGLTPKLPNDATKYLDGTGAYSVPPGNLSAPTRSLNFVIDGGGSAITTGIAGDVFVDFACTISKVTLLADQSGSIVIDIWKAAYASYPPTISNTITASALPTLSSAAKNQDSTLTGWTKAISAGDCLRFNVNSASTVTRVVLALTVS